MRRQANDRHLLQHVRDPCRSQQDAAQGDEGRTMHRSAPHFAPETRIPLRATLQTSTTGS